HTPPPESARQPRAPPRARQRPRPSPCPLANRTTSPAKTKGPPGDGPLSVGCTNTLAARVTTLGSIICKRNREIAGTLLETTTVWHPDGLDRARRAVSP